MFDIQADDGARVYVDVNQDGSYQAGELVIDAWTAGSSTTSPIQSASIALPAGRVGIRVEYYNLNGSGLVNLRWQSPASGSLVAIPASSTFLDATTSTNGWTGTYWANTSFIGLPRYGDYPTAITLNFGTSQPTQTLPASDNYSARWEGYLQPSTTGTYTFDVQADDGARVYLDVNQSGTFETTPTTETIIDAWTSGSSTTTPIASTTYTLTAGQRYKMRVEYYEGTGNGLINLRWKLNTGSFAAIPVTNVFRDANTTTTGWWASYFSNATLTAPPLYSVQDTSTSSITYNYSSGKPATGNVGTAASDNWAAVWVGYLNPSATGNFTFSVTADDGARVYVNNQLVIDAWTGSSGVSVTSVNVPLTLNTAVPIRVEYNELTSSASCILQWTPPSSTKATIPAANFFQDAAKTLPGLTGNYWTDTGMLGAPSFSDHPTQINFSYSTGQPSQSLVVTDFSATWDGYLAPTVSGNYTFDIQADDQAKVYVNNVLVIDAWTVPNSSTVTPLVSGNVALTAGTRVPLRVEFADSTGPAVVKLRWSPPGGSGMVGIPSANIYRGLTSTQLGLLATYYSNTTLTAPYAYQVAENNSTAITYDFGAGRPDPSLPYDAFTVRWTGQVMPQYSEPYYFTVRSDDGARLWVNGQLLIDKWQGQGVTEWTSNPITLQAGVPYDIKLEYLEVSGSAEVHLNWYSNDQAKQIIPSNRLFPTITGTSARAGDLAAAAPSVTSSSDAVAVLGDSLPFSMNLSANNGGIVSVTGLPAWLTLTNGVLSGTPPAAGTYQFTVNATNAAGTGSEIVTLQVLSNAGQLTRDLWTTGVTGTAISSVPWTTTPTLSNTVSVVEDNTNSYAANTGERLRGYFTAPVTGNYYFWLASSNVAELWISNNAEPVSKVLRANVTGPTGTSARTWNTQSNQQSPWLSLIAGQKYYIEVLHNTGASGAANNLSVGWYLDPTGSSSAIANNSVPASAVTGGVIPGFALSPWDNPPTTTVPGTLYVTNLQGVGNLTNITATGGAFLRVNGSTAVLQLNYAGLTSGVVSRRIYNTSGQVLFDIDAQDRNYPGLKTSDGGFTWNMQSSDLTALNSGNVYLGIATVNNPNGEVAGIFGITAGSQTAPAVPSYPTWTDLHASSDAANSRFLSQATFGPSPADMASVKSIGYRPWLENQFNTAATHHVPYILANLSNDPQNPYSSPLIFNSWWQKAVTAPDQFRQRAAFALSEILVVSDTGPLNNNGRILADYYDNLLDNCFGNFRDILKQITLTPAMGLYLDMRGNDVGSIVTGLHPNENYAREILQLFSTGLYRRWPDGSLVLDSSANAIPAYNQDVITGFARVFTGWTWGQSLVSGRLPTNYSPSSNYLDPMVLVSTHHELGSKILLDNVVLPPATIITQGDASVDSTSTYTVQSTDPVLGAGNVVTNTITNKYDLNGVKDLELSINNIMNNSAVGPYICRQLIQRLVTSHPKPEYVYRVVRAFNGEQNVDGVATGVRGDLKEVFRAILLDYEARSTTAAADTKFGKQREPLLRFTGPARAFPASSIANSTYRELGGQPYLITTPSAHRLTNGDTVYLDTFVDSGSVSNKTPKSQSYTVANTTPSYSLIGSTGIVTITAPGFKIGDVVPIQFTSGTLGTTSPYNAVRNYTVTSVNATASSPSFTIDLGVTTFSGTITGSAFLPNNFTVNNGAATSAAYVTSTNTVTVTASSSLGYLAGQKIYVSFASGTMAGGSFDGIYAISSVTSTNFTIPVTGASGSGNLLIPRMTGGYNVTSSGSVSSIALQTSDNHNLNVGDQVQIDFLVTNTGIPATSGVYTVDTISSINPNLFTVKTATAITAGSQGTTGMVVYPLTTPPWNRSGTVTVNFGTWNIGYTQSNIIQTPLDSTTVFNFFYPDYQYPGAMAAAGMTTPEFQLTNDSNTMNLTNTITGSILSAGNTYGYTSFNSGGGAVVMDLGPYMTAAQTSDSAIPALVDSISTLLTGGNLSSAARSTIISYVANTTNFPYTTGAPTNTQMRDRVRAIVHLIVTSAEYAIQK